jgi:ABC-2 type transport system ATP-binding protein
MPMIQTRGLTKCFGNVLALDDLDLEVQRGEVFGFLGPNGAGKSTTIRLLLGLIRPTAGEAWLGGVPVGDVERAHRSVSYVPGDVSLWPQLTGAETLELLGNVSGGVDREFRDELIERFNLDVSKRARAYSKGNRQKVALVAAFMTRPEILLLDEPTAGLDPLMEAEFQALAREASKRGQTVFLSSHILDEVEDLCSRVAILRSGRLVEVAVLQDLRDMTTTVLEATLEGPVPELDDVAGVVGVEPMHTGVRVTVAGRPDAVLQRLLTAGIVRLQSRAPTLEQVFLTYYDVSPEQVEAVAAAHGGGPVHLEGRRDE